MGSLKPTYHLPPSFSTPPPPKGPFHLGTVIKDFDRREQTRPQGSKCVGVDVSGPRGKRSENDTSKFESVDTEYFYPSPSYISQCMELSDVKEYMEVTKYKKAVYLVTGLKVAKGAAVRLEADTESKRKLEVGLNNPGFASTQLGPRTEGKVEEKPVDDFKESNDIVVGIRCLGMKDVVYTDGAIFLGDEVKKQEVPFEDLAFAAPEDYDNTKFSAHSQVTGEGTDGEIWIITAGLV
ncbi:hypothetical protein V8C34DRAFT_318237 [Trichoderma compactum]